MKVTPIVKELRKMNILIVTKDDSLRMSLESILNKYGLYNRTFLDCVKTAEEMCMCGITTFDVVILDWNSLDKECTRKFCKVTQKLNFSAPIVFITSKSTTSYYEAFEMGALDVLRNPTDEKKVIDVIWSAAKIENFRKDVKDKELHTFKRQAFFRLAQNT